jgi:alpha-glucoside transport system substrate-binding protein
MKILILVGALVAGLLTACSAGSSAGSVSIVASWTGAEGDAFKRVLAEFTAETGISVDYQGTRAVGPVLDSELQQGNPPDVAVLPNPGALATYMHSGDLRPLDSVIKDPQQSFSPQWLRLQRLGTNDHLYAIAFKADLKSLIWYDPKRFSGPVPKTWADLTALDDRIVAGGGMPWCMGLEAPPTSGWPGTDWVEDILLHQSGTAAYEQWASGRLPWTSDAVRKAWTTWGTVLNTLGETRKAAVLTNFGDAGRGLFSSPQSCTMEHEGSFIMGNYQGYPQKPQPGKDFDFFPTPGTDNAAEVSADLAGMFTDTSQAKALMRFLAGARAQRIWPEIPGYGAFSPNKNVRGDKVYSDPVSRRISQLLTTTAPLCFDAADMMPAAMSAAFSRAVFEFVDDPARLPDLLSNLDAVRRSLAPSAWLSRACG